MQTQQEELRRSNENLEEQTEALKRSEELLQRQQEELEHFNTELIAKTRALEEQVREVEEKNDEIEKTKTQLEQQATQLSMTSKYKSEFLANMSHELRTPLNSLLILSQLLSENKGGNLTDKQQEYAQTIYMSGADLLKMIDEILDLSKVDAGKMDINYETVRMEELTSFVQQNFGPMANKKELNLNIDFDSDLPEWVYTDSHRVKQILRNLLSNAFKFTNRGSVSLIGRRMKPEELPGYMNTNQEYLGFSVKDTGIGIPSDKTDLIFEAFQQVDGTTSRKYGGTGLDCPLAGSWHVCLVAQYRWNHPKGKVAALPYTCRIIMKRKPWQKKVLQEKRLYPQRIFMNSPSKHGPCFQVISPFSLLIRSVAWVKIYLLPILQMSRRSKMIGRISWKATKSSSSLRMM